MRSQANHIGKELMSISYFDNCPICGQEKQGYASDYFHCQDCNFNWNPEQDIEDQVIRWSCTTDNLLHAAELGKQLKYDRDVIFDCVDCVIDDLEMLYNSMAFESRESQRKVKRQIEILKKI